MKEYSRRAVQLSDLFTIKHGYAFKGEHFGSVGSHIVLTPGNFFDEGGFKNKGDKEKWYSGAIPEEYILSQGDLLVVMTEQAEGLLGSAAFVPENGLYLHNQRLGLIQNLRGIENHFLYYLFNSQHVRQQIRASCSGVKVRHTSPPRIYEVKVDIPPLPTQRKIAAILSAYDNLIENNTRRIRILEEMAQAIYREWFIHFRYPGHENVSMVESELGLIPEGWEYSTLGDILANIESGSRPKGGINPSERGIPSIGAENIIGIGQYDFSKEKYVSRKFYENMRQGHLHSDDVLLYKDGAQIGRKSMFKNGFPHHICCINEHVFILRTNNNLCDQNYLYFWLDQPIMTENIKNLNANAAQPGINQASVKGLKILMPIHYFIEMFDQIANPILSQLFNLAKKNVILRQSRDLLLPKLVSGKIDVSELEIVTGEPNG